MFDFKCNTEIIINLTLNGSAMFWMVDYLNLRSLLVVSVCRTLDGRWLSVRCESDAVYSLKEGQRRCRRGVREVTDGHLHTKRTEERPHRNRFSTRALCCNRLSRPATPATDRLGLFSSCATLQHQEEDHKLTTVERDRQKVAYIEWVPLENLPYTLQ